MDPNNKRNVLFNGETNGWYRKYRGRPCRRMMFPNNLLYPWKTAKNKNMVKAQLLSHWEMVL